MPERVTNTDTASSGPTEGDGEQAVGDVLSTSAANHGGRCAAVHGDRSWTYDELDRRASSLAGLLVEVGAAKGTRCALVMRNDPEHLAAIFATARAGLVAVPVNARHQPPEVAYQLSDAGAETVVVSPEMWSMLGDTLTPGTAVRRVVVVPGAGEDVSPNRFVLPAGVELHLIDLHSLPHPHPRVRVTPDDPYVIYYTAGTTGRPKGAVHTNRSSLAASRAWTDLWEIGPSDVVMCANLYHVAVTAVVLGTLRAGGALVFLDNAFAMESLLSDVERHRVTFFLAYSAIFGLLDRQPDLLERFDLSSVTRVGYGASPIDPNLVRRMMDLLPGRRWYNMWGQSEVNSGGTCLMPDDHPARVGSIGRPIACVDAVSIQDEDGNALPPGERGELCTRGPTVMLGYHHNPEATAETMRGGWLHTGDVAFVDGEGYFWLVDRKKDLIIRGGENIYPAEVEAVLCAHPGVHEAAVVAVPDTVMGEVPMAYVVARPGAEVTAEALLDHCATALASFKRPVHLEFVDDFPRNAVGKVLKFELRERARPHAR